MSGNQSANQTVDGPNEERLLMLSARVYALMDAIRSGNDGQTIEFAGVSRNHYVEVPEIDLEGCSRCRRIVNRRGSSTG